MIFRHQPPPPHQLRQGRVDGTARTPDAADAEAAPNAPRQWQERGARRRRNIARNALLKFTGRPRHRAARCPRRRCATDSPRRAAPAPDPTSSRPSGGGGGRGLSGAAATTRGRTPLKRYAGVLAIAPRGLLPVPSRARQRIYDARMKRTFARQRRISE